ncbi:hypothetical protein FGADI_11515 [Fusarium gaditjirri]|uniref:Peptidase S8/S53 domain-containing protein n=1 Tax=Fusarium gaditjirri TaxID=282569 RepID=A0A8H4SUC6_9HYPO|nr:hypothetical protein FGADI_11515 [Fusarium gaditjirri]
MPILRADISRPKLYVIQQFTAPCDIEKQRIQDGRHALYSSTTKSSPQVSTEIPCATQQPDTSEAIADSREVTRQLNLQHNAPWNLARISRGHAGNDSSTYCYDATAGSGAYVYLVDSGIKVSHPEFSGRAFHGVNFALWDPVDDECSHGTHMAGIIGGKTYGVAKNCTIISVKVVDKDGHGGLSRLGEGIQWATNDAVAKGIADRSVMTITVGCPYEASINYVVEKATDAGITVVVPAGNWARPASLASPASVKTAITVAASDRDDRCTPWSNYGPCVDIFAPGVDIASASHEVDDEPRVANGTSPAAAHVAGLAAYFISSENLRGSKAVKERILGASVNGIITNERESSNRLAYNDSRVPWKKYAL